MTATTDRDSEPDVVRLAREAFVSDTSYAVAIVTAATEPSRDK